MTKPIPTYIDIEFDDDADFSWLEQDCFQDDPEYADPDNHVQLMVSAWDDEHNLLAHLGQIDFIKAEDNWTTGCFESVGEIPSRCDYLREIARDMHLREGN